MRTMLKRESVFLLYILLIAPILLFGQLELKGKVKDSLGPVEFANIILTDAQDEIITGGITDVNGSFLILTKPGVYIVTISFIGYSDVIKEVEINSDLDLGIINLVKSSTELDEVILTSRKKIFEKKIDRLVFNLSEVPSVQGGNMVDALGVTPRVKIQDDKVSIIGKDNVQVMVNGKITRLSGDNLTSFLSSISADDIEKVEVITTPPARYSAEGNSGLINIVYKKGRRNSWSSTIRGSYTQATYGRGGIGANLDYNKNKISIKGSINYIDGSRLLTDSYSITYPDQEWTSVAPRRVFYDPILNGRISLDYTLNDNVSVGVQYLVNSNDRNTESDDNTQILNRTTRVIDSLVNTTAVSTSASISNSFNTYATFKLDSLGKNITLNLDYFSFENERDRLFESGNFTPGGDLQAGSFNAGNIIGAQGIDNYAAGIDVELPLKSVDLSFGGKLSFTRSDNDIQIFDTSQGTPILDTNQSNEFEFQENTQAVYFSINKSLSKKWKAQLGLRLENTNTTGFSPETNQETKNDYLRLFPTAYLSFDPNESDNFSINVSSRIRRPTFEFLNPFRIIQNQFSFVEGNPLLLPSFSDNVEFSYTRNNNWVNTLYFSQTKNGFSQVTLADENTNIQQTIPLNYLDERSFGLSESYTLSPFDWFRSYNSLDVYYSSYDSAIPNIDVNDWEISAYFQTNNTFTLNKNRTVSISANFWIQFPTSGELYSTSQYNNLDLALRVSLLNKQLQIGITGTDIFSSYRPQFKEVTNNLNLEYNNYADNRGLRVSMSYRFGNSKINVRQRNLGNTDERRRAIN